MSSDENPLAAIEAAGYAYVPAETITALARLSASGDAIVGRVGGVYLRVLVAEAKRAAGNDMRPVALGAAMTATQRQRVDRDAVDTANAPLYAAVMDGVTTADVAYDHTLATADNRARALERNRRSNFARTAVSTLRTWLRTGGALNALDVATVTKAGLTADIVAARALDRTVAGATVASGTDAVAAALKAGAAWRAALRRVATVDRDRADDLARSCAEAVGRWLRTLTTKP